jgi:ubiquitin-like modifier-activating enzyme ATG7
MGLIPQHIRGSVGSFEVNMLYSRAFNHCLACSAYVVEAFMQDKEKKREFISSVINNPAFLQVNLNGKDHSKISGVI